MIRASRGTTKPLELLGGVTELGTLNTKIYASAVRKGVFSVLSDRRFDPVTNTKLVILHEYSHARGVRDELEADRQALEALGCY